MKVASAPACDPTVDVSTGRLIAQGAEARVYEVQFLGRPTIVKQRFNKKYRHAILDAQLTAARLKQEARVMVKARKLGAWAPVVYCVEHDAATIYMEKVGGRSVKEAILSGDLGDTGLTSLLGQVGEAVAVLHDGGLVHGDLTTSNMLVRESDGALVIIDFGLSYTSSIAEDKAVDLYVLERACTSAHSKAGPIFEKILAAYKAKSKYWNPTLNKFAEVRMRGRKRSMVG